MSDDVSNLGPEFDEAGLTKLAEGYEALLTGESQAFRQLPIMRRVATRARMLRAAIAAHDRLRERCLMAETRERLLLTRLGELERQ